MEILQKYCFEPNYRNLQLAAQNVWADRLPLYEHIVGENAIFEITGNRPMSIMYSPDLSEAKEGFRQYWDFFRQMGYDTASIEFGITEILPGGGALGSHVEGCINTRADFDRYPWEELPELFFSAYIPYMRLLEETCPAGMKAVGGVGNGVFECVQDLVGYIDLCFMKDDDPDLFADLFARMGEVQYRIWKRMMEEFSDVFCVLRFGDDLGFNTATLLSPEDIRTHIIPQYRRITDLVHQKGKPFLLHSCGCIFEVFDELIDQAGIDAKHSNEDSIAHFSVWVDRYGHRIGNFGGIDTDVLCRNTPEEIRLYILDCLDRVAGHGGIAFSSGNSIPDYVPVSGYLAMVETVRDWRGDKKCR